MKVMGRDNQMNTGLLTIASAFYNSLRSRLCLTLRFDFRNRINGQLFLFKIILLGALLLLTPTRSAYLQSQTNLTVFQSVNSEQGLSQATVRCIFQDNKGFMWFGTQDGLNKYDGYSFTVYRHDQEETRSLSNNSIAAIYEDRTGTLWVGTTGGGLNRFNRETEEFSSFQHDPSNPQSISGNSVSFIYQDSSGALWVGTNNGLNLLDSQTNSFVRYLHDPSNSKSLSDNVLRWACEDKAGALWIGTEHSGLEKFDRRTGEFTHYQFDRVNQRSPSTFPVSSIYEDSRGALWVGTEGGGIYQLDRQSGEFTRFKHDPNDTSSLADDNVRAIYEDKRGSLWIGTNNGLDSFDRQKSRFVHYRHDPAKADSLNDNSIFSLYEDRSGVLWVGTSGGGVNKLNRSDKRFVTYRNDPTNLHSLSDNSVAALYDDGAGKLWIGTSSGGLNLYDRETGEFKRYQHDPFNPRSLSSNSVTAIREDNSGALWVATNGGGVNRLDRQTGEFKVFRHQPSNPRSLSDDRVWQILEDKSKRLWIGTANGLNRFNFQTGEFDTYRHSPSNPASMSDNNVRALLEDRSGTLWIGTRGGGLNMFDRRTGEFSRYRHEQTNPGSLSSDAVYCLYEDATGTLWVGTTEGINQFDPVRQTFAHFTEKDGLSNNTIYAILGDRQGNLWISTNKGISRFNPQTRTFRNYDEGDGLQDNEFNGAAAFQSAGGEMFFGGINGFNSFRPEEIKDSLYQPPVVLTAFKKFDQKVKLDKALEDIDEIEVSYKDNVFSFEFAALDYTSPLKNQYAYRLEGFDKDWNYSGTRRVAIYTNLDGGNYLFRVKASNSDGVWNEQGVSVRIRVVPPFWKTWWFVTLVCGTVVLVGIVAYKRRISRLQRARVAQEAFSRQLIESQETERKRIAAELHDSLGQNLLIIKNRALLGLTKRDEQEFTNEQLNEISSTASQAIEEVREIARNLRPYQLDRFGLTKALESIIKRAASSSAINFSSHLAAIDDLLSKEAEINLYRIVQEGLNNILKHSHATEATLLVEREGRAVRLEMKDNGVGFSGETLTGEDADGRGFGLAGIAERARIIGAKHSIRSVPGQGTTITLKLMLQDNNHE